MNRNKKMIAAALLLAASTSAAFATDPEPTAIDSAITTAQTLFGTVAALCVLVTGFFLGRKWLKRV